MDLPYDLYLKLGILLGIFHLRISGSLKHPSLHSRRCRVPVVLQVHGGHTHHGDTSEVTPSALLRLAPRAKEHNGERVGSDFWGSVEWGWSKCSLDEMDGFLGRLNGRFSKMEDMLLLFWRSRCFFFKT